MEALKEKQMYVNEMHKEQQQRVSNITHILGKLKELELLNIEVKPISKKTKPHNFFDLKHDAYVILVEKEDGIDDVKKYSILKKIFKDSVKISCIGIAGAVTWITTNIINNSHGKRKITSSLPIDTLLPIIFTVIIIGIGLSIFYFTKIKNKK